MQYRLKANVESFEVVDGPFAGRKYVSGEIYTDIPPGEKGKFDTIAAIEEQVSKRGRTDKPEVTDA